MPAARGKTRRTAPPALEPFLVHDVTRGTLADIPAVSFDHLVSAGEEGGWDGQIHGFSSFEIDHEFKLCQCLGKGQSPGLELRRIRSVTPELSVTSTPIIIRPPFVTKLRKGYIAGIRRFVARSIICRAFTTAMLLGRTTSASVESSAPSSSADSTSEEFCTANVRIYRPNSRPLT